MMHGRGECRFRHSSWETDEQGGAIRCGAGGGGQGECAPAKHGPGTKLGNSVNHALQPHARARGWAARRHLICSTCSIGLAGAAAAGRTIRW